MSWYKNYRQLDRARKLSIVFTGLIVVGLVLLAIGLFSTLKVTRYKVYKDTAYGFEIKFPADWNYAVRPNPGTVIKFAAPKDGALDRLYENVNVSIKDMPRPMTIEHISNLIVNQVAGTFGERIDISQNIPQAVGGHPGYRLTFAGYGKEVRDPIQYVVTWTIIDSRVYIITFTGLKEDYPKYEKRVNAIFQSFKFMKK